MTVFSSLPHCQYTLSSNLPLTLMNLDDWILVNVKGQDSEKYLQSQVTADVVNMHEYQHLLVSHCNHKGKVWSNLRLFRRNEGFSFIERRSVSEIQINEFKKYLLSSKVTIVPDDSTVLLGIAGFQARDVLKDLFKKLPDKKKQIANDGITHILWLEYPKERFLLVTNEITADYIYKLLKFKVNINDSNQWLALHIEAGIPIIDLPNTSKFMPQEMNIQALGGISFKKGCYIGQEIVARAKFRGISKRILQFLIGSANRVPKAGENLEIKVNSNRWNKIGTILAAVPIARNQIILQAVMNNIIERDSIFRIPGDVNTLNIKNLPSPT